MPSDEPVISAQGLFVESFAGYFFFKVVVEGKKCCAQNRKISKTHIIVFNTPKQSASVVTIYIIVNLIIY